jgi:[protein-PII] uridylyltransferase
MLGMLLHDIGKGKGHGHVAKGIPLIGELTARIGLDEKSADAVTFLVAHHLTLSHMAQRRDIDDPKTVESLVDVVQTAERLRMLYLLTHADMRAVGPGVMTAWQARVLWELFNRAMVQLTRGRLERPSREAVADRVLEMLGREGSRRTVLSHLALLTDRYLLAVSPQRIAAHLRLVERLEEDVAATEVFQYPDLGSSELVIVTKDVPGLFSLIAGCLAAEGINVLSAQIHTRTDGIAIDTFQVNDPFGEPVTEEARWRRTLEGLNRVLRGELTVETMLASRRSGRAVRETILGPPKVTVDNDRLSATHTVVEVKCPDRVGVLYMITRTFSALGLDIGSARIATEIDQVYDTFYVTDRQGHRIEDPATIERLREALEEELQKPL